VSGGLLLYLVSILSRITFILHKTISLMGVSMDSIVFQRQVVWQPKEVVDLGDGCRMGITSDDGYYMVLSPSYTGSWKPSSWIPPVVAKRLGELAAIQIAISDSLRQ
jgi:hypothetical protein